MDMQRIFILLGLAVTSYMLILAWNEDYGQQATQPQLQPETEILDNAIPEMSEESASEISNDVPQLVDSSVKAVKKTTKRQLVRITTDVFEIHVDRVGGDIVRVALPGYPASLGTPDIPFILVDSRNDYVAQSGLIGGSGTDKQNGERPTFLTEATSYDMGAADELAVTLFHTQENGTEIRKVFVFKRGDYLIDVRYDVNNLASTDWRAGLFVQIKRDSQDPQSEADNLLGMQPYVGGATRSDDEFYHKLEFDDIEEETYRGQREEGYIAFVQHYFVSAWVPTNESTNTYQARKLKGKDTYLFGFTTTGMTVPAGGQGSLSASYYAGPKDQYRLQEIATGLDLTVDYGFLWWLAQPLFYLLTFIHSYVDNWGLAIIGLTIIVKTLLYPLSAASFRSMAKMRKLQPEMVKLKERYGEDRQKFSQATMDLYKKEGANPLGGCFPILLQMPVFLALYWSLMESVELRQAPFMLWIHDLSAMDPYFILPILMGISMYLTQRLQPEPPDPIQAKVFKFMPIMFTFFFLWFPSGLVLYWLVNNILSICQQYYVTRQIEKAT